MSRLTVNKKNHSCSSAYEVGHFTKKGNTYTEKKDTFKLVFLVTWVKSAVKNRATCSENTPTSHL